MYCHQWNPHVFWCFVVENQDEEEYEGILYGYGFSYVFLNALFCVDHVVVLVEQFAFKKGPGGHVYS